MCGKYKLSTFDSMAKDIGFLAQEVALIENSFLRIHHAGLLFCLSHVQGDQARDNFGRRLLLGSRRLGIWVSCGVSDQ